MLATAAPPAPHSFTAPSQQRPRSPSFFSRVLKRVTTSDPAPLPRPLLSSDPQSDEDLHKRQDSQQSLAKPQSPQSPYAPSVATQKDTPPSPSSTLSVPRGLFSRLLRRTEPLPGSNSATAKTSLSALSFAAADLDELPVDKLQDAASLGPVFHLDLSENNLRNINGIEVVAKDLDTLILDSNCLSHRLPISVRFPRLRTLSLNKNEIKDIDALLTTLKKNFPNLQYLSFLKNPGVPDYFSADQEDYQRHRWYVIHRLPDLRFLDSRPITPEERAEALRVGPFQKTAKLDPDEFERQRRHTFTEPTPSSNYADYASYGTGSISHRGLSFSGFDPATGAVRSPDSEPSYTPAPLSTELTELGNVHATFGRSRYVYNGRHSEGNRFIRNGDL